MFTINWTNVFSGDTFDSDEADAFVLDKMFSGYPILHTSPMFYFIAWKPVEGYWRCIITDDIDTTCVLNMDLGGVDQTGYDLVPLADQKSLREAAQECVTSGGVAGLRKYSNLVEPTFTTEDVALTAS